MSLNRGQPSDVDERPFVRCHGCDKLLKCYRGRLLRQVANEKGTWELYAWWCDTCMARLVAEALA